MTEYKVASNVRLKRQAAVTAALWAGTFVFTKGDWLRPPAPLPARIAFVAIGIGGFVPMLFVYAKSIRMQDEFTQRIHLIALAITFAVMALISYAADIFAEAGFIAHVPGGGVWALMVGVWFICMLVTPRFYR